MVPGHASIRFAKSPHRRPVWLLPLVLSLAIALVAVLPVLGRAVPLGNQARLEVWVSLAVETAPADAIWIGLESTTPPSQRRGLADVLSSWLRRWSRQVTVRVATDQAAVALAATEWGATRFPLRVRGLPLGLDLKVVTADRHGSMALLLAGRRIELKPGAGLDFALVPAAGSDGWLIHDGPWRAEVLERLAARQPVGRLTLVNLGLARSGTWPE